MISTYRETQSLIDKREVQLLSLAFVFLFWSALAISLAPAVRLGTWKLSAGNFQHFIVLPVWVIGNFLILRTIRVKLPKRDPLILPVGALLAGWGMLTIWRLEPTFGARQTGWFFLAAILLFVLFRAPLDLRWLKHYRYLWLGGGLFLLGLTLFFGTNPLGGEPKLWLGCCGLYFQPSEPLRLLLIAFLASYFSDRLAFNHKHESPSLIHTVIPLVVVWSFSILLLFVQRDLGTGSLFLILLAMLLYIASGKWHVIIIAALMTIAGGALAYLNMDLVRVRVEAWLNPWLDPVGGSYQIVQSLIAIASGGIFGSGVGLGEPGLVPAAHTDFIFTAVAEEWGMLGAIGMLALIAVLVARGIKVAAQTQQLFDKLLAAGISIAFGLQSILIISGVTRLLPLTGITLPFVSYGGSSLVTSFIALGLLLLISNKSTRASEPGAALSLTQMGLNVAWIIIALVLGWWGILRATALTTRTDNLRTIIAERYFKRGTIYDSSDRILAESVGQIGDFQREYPYSEYASVIGYQSMVFGKSGIERSLDSVLHGVTGQDPYSLAWSELLYGRPAAGLDIKLSLDAELQIIATNVFQDENGALVLIGSSSGDILTLVTSPSYDPNSLELHWGDLIADGDAPLFNRTTQARYQPGMAILPFLIAWGESNDQFHLEDLSEHAFSSVLLGDIELECESIPQDDLEETLLNALKLQCPGAFTHLVEVQGYDWIVEAYDAFGFTDEILIRMDTAEPIELGSSPTSMQLKLSGIGQSDLLITPIQMGRAFAAIASDGTLPPLRIVESTRNADGRWIDQEPLGQPETVISPEAALRVMRAAQTYQNGVRGFTFSALTGPGGQKSSWFLGRDSEGQVLVILLEDGNTTQVERIALEFFQNLASIQSP